MTATDQIENQAEPTSKKLWSWFILGAAASVLPAFPAFPTLGLGYGVVALELPAVQALALFVVLIVGALFTKKRWANCAMSVTGFLTAGLFILVFAQLTANTVGAG